MATDTRERILEFIKQYKAAHDGCSPSYQAVVAGVDGVNSTAVVSYHLKRLAEQGFIRLPETRGGKRGIEVVGGRWEMVLTAWGRETYSATCRNEEMGMRRVW